MRRGLREQLAKRAKVAAARGVGRDIQRIKNQPAARERGGLGGELQPRLMRGEEFREARFDHGEFAVSQALAQRGVAIKAGHGKALRRGGETRDDAEVGEAEELERGLAHPGQPGLGVRTLLTVAREDPAAFTLLWRHAPREEQFATYAQELRSMSVAAVRDLMQIASDDPTFDAWSAEVVIGWLVEAVLTWLEVGEAAGNPADFSQEPESPLGTEPQLPPEPPV